MTRQDFEFLYFIGETLPNDSTLYPAAQARETNLQDTLDDTANNGQTFIGDDMFWSEGGRAQLAGFTGAGDPIIFFFGNRWIASNNGSLGGSLINPVFSGTYLYCFTAGTHFETPGGATAVEALDIGDLVADNRGGWVPVKCVGRQTVSTRFGPAERLMPQRVRAGALADGVPQRDLVLTADHALLIDGLLINAGALVNGSSIDYVPLSELGESYTVYHIETEDHDVILAEGAPAETYVDYVARRAFDNYAEYLALYGEERTIPEMPTPRISSARLLPGALKHRLAARDAA